MALQSRLMRWQLSGRQVIKVTTGDVLGECHRQRLRQQTSTTHPNSCTKKYNQVQAQYHEFALSGG
jgi:hypothetical protein